MNYLSNLSIHRTLIFHRVFMFQPRYIGDSMIQKYLMTWKVFTMLSLYRKLQNTTNIHVCMCVCICIYAEKVQACHWMWKYTIKRHENDIVRAAPIIKPSPYAITFWLTKFLNSHIRLALMYPHYYNKSVYP